MILIDETSKGASNVNSNQETDYLQAVPPPPAYGATQSRQQDEHAPSSHRHGRGQRGRGRHAHSHSRSRGRRRSRSPESELPRRSKRARRRRSMHRRVCQIFFGISLACALPLLAWQFWLLFSKAGDHPENIGHPEFSMDNGSTLLDCVRGPGWITESHDGSHGEARRVFDIPLDAEHTFVIARGVLSSGSVVLSTSNEVTDSVRIDVSLKFNHRDILDRAKVCRVRDEEGGEGVGLFTPRSWNWPRDEDSYPHFSVKVYFPARHHKFKIFSTDLPSYEHQLLALHTLHFESLSLRSENKAIYSDVVSFTNGSFETTNSCIEAQGLHGRNIIVRTSNSPINGYFNASDSLELRTSNAPMKVAVDLGHLSSDGTSSMKLSTLNNALYAKVDSFSPISHIEADNENGPLFVSIEHSLLDSRLTVDLRTTNAPAELYVPPEYEGSFDLATSSYVQPRVIMKDLQLDPAHEGRARTLSKRGSSSQSVVGNVYWSPGHRDRGRIFIRTSNSPLQLYV